MPWDLAADLTTKKSNNTGLLWLMREELFFPGFKYKKSNPITGLDRPRGFQEDEAPRVQDNRHMKLVRLSVLRIGRLYPP